MKEDFKKEILTFADFSKDFVCGDARLTLMKNNAQNEHKYLFGFLQFGSPQDTKVVFRAMEDECRQRGIEKVLGPVNFCSWFGYRLTVGGFEKNIFPDIDNTAEQADLLREMGYKEKYLYYSKIISVPKNACEQYSAYERQGEYTFKIFKGDEALPHIRETFEISLDCYSDALLFSPIPYSAYEQIYLEGLKGVNPCVLAVYRENIMVGYVFFYENPDKEFFVAKTIGLKKECQKGMLTARLVRECIKIIAQSGHTRLAFHYQKESLKDFLRFSEDQITFKKTYAVFEKEIN